MDLLWAGGRLLVAGPDTGPHPGGEVHAGVVAGIRLAPGTAPALLGVPAHVLRDRRVGLADLWPAREVRRLTGLVAAYGDPRAGLEALARARAAETGPADPFAAEVVARLRAGRPVAEIAGAAGLGERQLHRRSLHSFGYGPRTPGRILRLRRALALGRAREVPPARRGPARTLAALSSVADAPHRLPPPPCNRTHRTPPRPPSGRSALLRGHSLADRGLPYAEVAYAAGYADQAHLAREVRALAGTTLTAYSGGAAGAKRETPQPSGSRTTA
ncbi:AraC family transcriptional regulator [Streptomyces sp. MMS21 TC-5]|uniref:AraC family transcriptional regulator n=1 Tax=Streptomyces sp. MMS21 TC-5 TaxID=2925833 RepID=UPI001F61A99A|nr:AraC family transcriptional regulator [Streptomyces sp. MMS21 TC-5]MCI4084496.1 AraC family transcriptional regulator [Streptomyces sp. MMS21 TC-5]